MGVYCDVIFYLLFKKIFWDENASDIIIGIILNRF